MGRPRIDCPKKNCAFCGKELTRKNYNGILEDRTVFMRRKYCDQICMAKAMVQERVTLAALRARAEKYRGKKCQLCGAMDRLQVHHLDQNPANNTPENLTTLCASCHSKWHWTHGKKSLKRQAVCKICGEPARKLDMCQKHYQRFKKYGDPLLTKKKIGSKYELVQEIPGTANGPESRE